MCICRGRTDPHMMPPAHPRRKKTFLESKFLKSKTRYRPPFFPSKKKDLLAIGESNQYYVRRPVG